MPYRVEGWIEVTIYDGVEQEKEYAWMGFVNICAVIGTGDTISEKLFGLSKRCSAREFIVDSLAADRGLPPYPYDEVEREMKLIRRPEKKHGGPTGYGGYTYAKWSEIKKVSFSEQELEDSDWPLLFDIAQRLESDYRYTDEKIRFVVWFNW
jgi:hypothetical protein